ncbi:type II toxin-antitoxin system RelE/ParE family toxin [Sphingobium boeckii]|uniref:Toxin ParE1/3/4 n=1 Tax=Sphingobium boeckii TaxID=1082345 RepID=A0A7W9ECW1_9SPHN|nr:type II toxin-antitoxin system RelE/ParE family toxin [Sphingobium boeckii]MBB5684678.1 toxin ParE1/3/4 [Sphingobium boeckii]
MARRDIVEQYRWLEAEAGSDVADHFLTAANEAFYKLADHPRIGPALGSTNPHLAGMHKWKVEGFPNVLIFYKPRVRGISVVRIIHAASDWWSLIDSH